MVLKSEAVARTNLGHQTDKKVVALRNFSTEERKEYRRLRRLKDCTQKLEGCIPSANHRDQILSMAVSHANKVGKATGGNSENSNLIVAASAYILRKQGNLKADLKSIIGTLDKGSTGLPVKFKSVVKTAQSI